MTFFLRIVQPLLGGVLERRAGRMARHIAGQVTDGEHVLDIGCGDLRIARRVTAIRDVHWTGIDTVDYRDADVPTNSGDGRILFRTYDGGELPFAASTFDAVVLAFVLHHCADQNAVIDEAIRVARSRVIVFEATPRSRVEHELAKPYDWLVNRLRSPDIQMPFTFLRRREVIAALESRGLRVVKIVAVKTHPIALVQQLMFVAEK